MGIPPFLLQTLVEYGLINSISARMVALRNKVEWYIGQGNTKYALLALLAVMFFLLVKRRR